MKKGFKAVSGNEIRLGTFGIMVASILAGCDADYDHDRKRDRDNSGGNVATVIL